MLSFELTLRSSFILFSICQFVFIVCFDASLKPLVKDEKLCEERTGKYLAIFRDCHVQEINRIVPPVLFG